MLFVGGVIVVIWSEFFVDWAKLIVDLDLKSKKLFQN